MYVFKIHLFPARLPCCQLYPAALHSIGPGLQIPRVHLASPPWQTASQPGGLQPHARYERQPSKVMGCWKLCYSPKHRIFLLSFPTHYSCQGQGFPGSPQSTQVIGFCHELGLKTSLHFKKVEGVEQDGGRYFCVRFGFEKGLTAYVCALPCNLKAHQDRTLKSILCWTIYTSQSKRTGSSLHPFQSAQLLLNQHRQKARQHYNKLAPLTICWSCCCIVCLFKTRANTHTQTSRACSLLPSPKLQICSLREASKSCGLNPCRATATVLGLCLGFTLSLQAKTKNAHIIPAWNITV